MSRYTSLMLIIPGVEDENVRIEEVKMYEIIRGEKIQLVNLNDESKFYDLLPQFVYAGTFNHFDLDSFLVHLKTRVNWEYPEYVQLIVQEEGAYSCKIYGEAGARLDVDSIKC